jgi:hypothetical protein
MSEEILAPMVAGSPARGLQPIKPLGGVIHIDQTLVQQHLGEVVRSTVEENLAGGAERRSTTQKAALETPATVPAPRAALDRSKNRRGPPILAGQYHPNPQNQIGYQISGLGGPRCRQSTKKCVATDTPGAL